MNNLLEFDVFLAHNSLDKTFVREIAKKLRRGRLKPWLDEDAILPGQIIQEEIQRIILHIKSTIIFIGKNGLGRWQKVELRTLYTQCIERGILVIPVLLPGVSDFPQELLFLKQHKWIHFIDSINDEKAIKELKLAIRKTKSPGQLISLKKPLKKTKFQKESLKSTTHLKSSPDIANLKNRAINVPSNNKPTNVKLLNTRITQINKSNPTSNRQKAKSTSTMRASKNKARTINNSGAWVLLNNNLFKTELVETQKDKSIILNILTNDAEEETVLRKLQPEHYNKKQIPYVYQNEADIMQVESVLVKSIKGKTMFSITIKPYLQEQINSFTEVNINGFSADKLAELRARLILLNELPNIAQNNLEHSQLNYWIQGYSNSIKIEKCIFLDLWKNLNTKKTNFLIHARLLAIYYLKMTSTVEHILELKLILNNNVLSVQFRGQRKQLYANQEPALIQVKAGQIPQQELLEEIDGFLDDKQKSLEEGDDDLSSECNVDYTQLRNLLADGNWKEADCETYRVMLKVVGHAENNPIRDEELLSFPCTDLRTIDGLWVKYSKKRFGFSVQKKIYLEVGGVPYGEYYTEAWKKFGGRVGWRVNQTWIDYDEITFDLIAPVGHLPRKLWRIKSYIGENIAILNHL